MSEQEEKSVGTKAIQPKGKVFVLTDETISLVREILQLSLYTGTNIVDHLRAVRLDENGDGKLVPNNDYVEAYNKMVSDFAERATAAREEAQQTQAGDSAPN